MKHIGIVQGNSEQAQELVIGKDTVYVHTNITPVEKEGKIVEDLFSYDEIQYGKDEYIAIMAAQNAELNTSVLDTQLALCEIYEAIGGTE